MLLYGERNQKLMHILIVYLITYLFGRRTLTETLQTAIDNDTGEVLDGWGDLLEFWRLDGNLLPYVDSCLHVCIGELGPSYPVFLKIAVFVRLRLSEHLACNDRIMTLVARQRCFDKRSLTFLFSNIYSVG